MKLPNLAVALVAGFTGLLAPAAAPHAQQQQNVIQLAMCNISGSVGVRVSIMYRDNARRWKVDGWYPLPDDGCTLVGSFPADTVYYYAIGTNRETNQGMVWSADEDDKTASPQCVNYDKAFTGPASVSECPSGQKLVRMRIIKVPAGASPFTYNLLP